FGLRAVPALSITGTEGVPLTVEPNALVTLPEGGDSTGNDDDRIALLGGTFDTTGVVPNLGVPYHVKGSIDTREGSSVTLTAGTEFIMSADTDIEFGWNSGKATIIAVGTESEPIRFVGADETPGFWQGISVRSNVLSSSRFKYVELGHAGGGSASGACLELNAPIPVENCAFFSSSGYGVVANADDPSDYAENNTFRDNESGAVGAQ
ncbi:hypothetical protein ACFL5O_11715, partial [Myxococcota bacterium]